MDVLLETVLGEALFGPDRYQFSPIVQLYYLIKPLVPRRASCAMRRILGHLRQRTFPLDWPIEGRYARFQWELARQLLLLMERNTLPFTHFWPEGQRFAFVLTHDIESAEGQKFAPFIADLEERLGFRSSFNFVPEKYSRDRSLIDELKRRGFEVGVHGLTHRSNLFSSYTEFAKQVKCINRYLEEWSAVGFRAPYMHRQPEWMQALCVEYDLSFFDTDPWEPVPGGTIAIWPYFLGHFVELPYTLVQDNTLFNILKQTTPDLWLEKVEFLRQYYGMALLNSHPDYLRDESKLAIYAAFLKSVQKQGNYWHALPREVARWWRRRAEDNVGCVGTMALTEEGLRFY
jgi:peptidoglycan/xylan/chitin deacetylase (PgdA/CDA1 family)